MKIVINPNYLLYNDFITSLPTTFASLSSATTLHEARNIIKCVSIDGYKLVIKRYFSLSLVNRVAYGRVRQSKSVRAYQNAHRLLTLGVNTPQPVAAVDCYEGGLLRGSYFVSEYSDFQPMSVVNERNERWKGELLEALAHFIAHIHQLEIQHNDLNVANVRYRRRGGEYEFELIDNNRIRFRDRPLTERERLNDLRHFSCDTTQFVYMLKCYSQLTGIDMDRFAAKGLLSRALYGLRFGFKQKLKDKIANIRISFVVLLLVSLMCGCVEYHPYDTHVDGAMGVNEKNIALIESECKGCKELRFAVVSDSQRWYDELERAVLEINSRRDIDFVIHAGDLSDFGMRTEFEAQREILNRLRVPYVCLIGNHDCIATGKEIFAKIFGAPDMAFTAGDVRFICLNTNALEYDDGSVPNLDFVEQQLLTMPSDVQRSVVVMHAEPFSDQFYNHEVALILQQQLRQLPDLQFCIHGHGHRYKEEDIFGDGVIYYECDNVGDSSFLIFTLDNEGYECEKVDF